MEKDSLTYKVLKNSSYSIFGHLWPIVFTLVITPVIVLTLGVKEYGVYLFITTSMGLLALFESGLYLAVLKDIAYFYGKKDEDAMRRLIHSANLLFCILASFYLIVSVAVFIFGTSFLPTSFSAYEKYSRLFVFAGGASFVMTLTATYSLILQAVQRFDIINKISMTSVTLSSLLTLLVVKMGYGLLGVFMVQLIVAIVFSYIYFYQAIKIVPIATFEFHWHKKEVINCYRFGIVAFVNNIASTALSSLDKLVIPFFAGPSNLTYYSMPGNVATRIPGISGALSVGMLPLASQLHGGDDVEKIKNLYIRTFRLIVVIAGALTITTISFSDQILRYWLSADFALHSSKVLIILVLTNFLLALFVPLSSFLLGLGKLKFLTISSLSMAVLNAVTLFLLLPLYGIVGAAYSYLISVLPILYMFYYVETRYLGLLNRKAHHIRTISGTVVTCLVMMVFNFFTASFIINLPTLLLIGGVSGVIYVVVYKVLGFFEYEDWRDIEYFSSSFLKKFNIVIKHG